MEKSIEMRVAELEKQVFHTKNVLSFEEASRFLNLSKSYLYKLTSGNLIPHYKPQGKTLFRAGGIGGMVASQSRQDAGTD